MIDAIKVLENNMAWRKNHLAEMRKKNDPKAAYLEIRLIGYKNALDDIRIAMEFEIEKMAGYSNE